MSNYLYNGVEAGAIPNRDKDKLPHAVMTLLDTNIGPPLIPNDSLTVHFLSEITITKELWDTNAGTYKDYVLETDGDKRATAKRAWDSTGAFPSFGDIEAVSDQSKFFLDNVVWTNTDLYRPDGALYLAASTPVPVLNPSVLMQGFMMGDAVKRMRAKRLLHDHTYSAEVTAPTCTEKGYTACTCASCGHRYVSNEVPATGHDYVSEVIDPTTKAQGYTQHTCSRCGDTYKDNYTERLPVAYRYGTVELPPLPEYDTTAYPYAFIFTSSSGTTYLYYSNQPFHGYSSVMDLVTNKTDCTMGTFKISDGVWIAGTAPKEYAAKAVTTNIPFWANYDVLDVHEQLWCAASEPVPIYEEEGKTPVGYLYGGVGPLPDIESVWTDELKARYPNVVIAPMLAEVYCLLCFSGGAYITYNDYQAPFFHASEQGYARMWIVCTTEESAEVFGGSAGEWLVIEDMEGEIPVAADDQLTVEAPVWSNFNILTADGSTYLAASEPVPVYE